MIRPKTKTVRRAGDESVNDYAAHAPAESFVRVAVSETENDQGPWWPKGTIIIDLERVEGSVIVRWTDPNDGTLRAQVISM